MLIQIYSSMIIHVWVRKQPTCKPRFTHRLHATSASQHLLIFACGNSNQYSTISTNLKSNDPFLLKENYQIALSKTEKHFFLLILSIRISLSLSMYMSRDLTFCITSPMIQRAAPSSFAESCERCTVPSPCLSNVPSPNGRFSHSGPCLVRSNHEMMI